MSVSEAVQMSQEGLMGRIFRQPGQHPKRPYKHMAWTRESAVNILIDVGKIVGPMPLDLEIQGEGYNVIIPLEGLVRFHTEAYKLGREHGEGSGNQEGDHPRAVRGEGDASSGAAGVRKPRGAD
jgi:hypothetical protein